MQNNDTQNELLEMLSEAEDDVKNSRVALMAETFDSLRKELLNEPFCAK